MIIDEILTEFNPLKGKEQSLSLETGGELKRIQVRLLSDKITSSVSHETGLNDPTFRFSGVFPPLGCRAVRHFKALHVKSSASSHSSDAGSSF